MHHQIMRSWGKGQHLVIRHLQRIGTQIPPYCGKTTDYGGCRKRSVNLTESFLKVGKDNAMQEHRRVMAGKMPGTRAMAG